MSPWAAFTFATALLVAPGAHAAPRDGRDSGVVRVLWRLNAFYCTFWHRLEVMDVDPLPARGPAILISNHTCCIDHMLIQAGTRRLLGFLIAKELYDYWLFRPFCEVGGCIPVRRDGKDVAATRAALRTLKEGRVVPIFPEGKILPTSGRELGEAKPGVAFIALRAGVPVFPAYICGTPADAERPLVVPHPVACPASISARRSTSPTWWTGLRRPGVLRRGDPPHDGGDRRVTRSRPRGSRAAVTGERPGRRVVRVSGTGATRRPCRTARQRRRVQRRSALAVRFEGRPALPPRLAAGRPRPRHLGTDPSMVTRMRRPRFPASPRPSLGRPDSRPARDDSGRSLRGCRESPTSARSPSIRRVAAGFAALAELHRRLSGYVSRGTSPGLSARLRELGALAGGGFSELETAVRRRPDDAAFRLALTWIDEARARSYAVRDVLVRASMIPVGPSTVSARRATGSLPFHRRPTHGACRFRGDGS